MTTHLLDAGSVPHLPSALRDDWSRLLRPTQSRRTFALEQVAELPEPAQRWLLHAIAPGTPLRTMVVMSSVGEINLGRWARYEADWLLAPPDEFIWAATTHLYGLPIRGYDQLTGGSGQMSWRLAGVLPVMRAAGPDVTRSAAGRVAAETCFVPATALGPSIRWEPLDDQRAVAVVSALGLIHRVTITVSETGALQRVEVPRWNNHDGHGYREHTFTAVMSEAEHTASGFTVPASVRAGWWHCPDQCASAEFFRLTLTDAAYI